MAPNDSITVIDLFAGPGGLGEGFSAFTTDRAHPPFRIGLSVEMDAHAHRTLRLRSFFRHYAAMNAPLPEAFYRVLRGDSTEAELATACPHTWARAEHEAVRAELGTDQGDTLVAERLRSTLQAVNANDTILLGGPPCQAYSLVGRSRNRGIAGYRAENDHRHVLYRQYLRIITHTWPAAFVMENVKGILSSELNGERIFPRILDDLTDPCRAESPTAETSPANRYRLYTLTTPTPTARTDRESLPGGADQRGFVVRSEQHGIPQRRHRVFVVGIREDIPHDPPPPLAPRDPVSVNTAIGDLPPLLPRVSSRFTPARTPADDSTAAARLFLPEHAIASIAQTSGPKVADAIRHRLDTDARASAQRASPTKADFVACDTTTPDPADDLDNWLHDPRLGGVCNHISKSHMPSDLARYLFASTFASVHARSPKLADFPPELLPSHANAESAARGKNVFSDRFRVQLAHEPATTITSHLAKDGHYYIHPDPSQMRSLSVREAARLQTFPDNYFFCGPRTSQYQQVGNAVPPFLARQIAASLHTALRRP